MFNAALATLHEPETYAETLLLVYDLKPEVTNLVFVDPTLVNTEISSEPAGESPGFFGSFVQTFTGLFSSSTTTIEDVISEMSLDQEVIKIDTTNPEMASLLDDYSIETVPWIVVLQDDAVLHSGASKPNLQKEEDSAEEVSPKPVEDASSGDTLYFSAEESDPTSASSQISASESVIGSPSYAVSSPTPTPVKAKNSEFVSTPFGKKGSAETFENIEENWNKILKEEEELVKEIKDIYDEDKKLSESLQESEDEIHESEELFYKAKNAIDKTLQDSEQQMREYETELDKLYNARLAAKRARDDLYHPYGSRIPTKDGYVKPNSNGQYKPVKRRQQRRPTNVNFHDMLRAADDGSARRTQRGPNTNVNTNVDGSMGRDTNTNTNSNSNANANVNVNESP